MNINDFVLENLRSQIGFVQQEPVLFDKTIRGDYAFIAFPLREISK